MVTLVRLPFDIALNLQYFVPTARPAFEVSSPGVVAFSSLEVVPVLRGFSVSL
jgi:hypothetical protein